MAQQSFDVPGTVEGIHEIDGITVIEYTDAGESYFRVYVDGDDTGTSVGSLSHALVYGVAYRHDGGDTYADIYFMRMIGADEDDG